MFGATSRFKKGDYDAFIYRIGGARNAMTTSDETIYKADLLPRSSASSSCGKRTACRTCS